MPSSEPAIHLLRALSAPCRSLASCLLATGWLATGGCFSDPGRAGDSGEVGGSEATSSSSSASEESSSTTGGVCGDGVQDEGEACDDGEANDDNAACTSECQQNVCGDGLLHEGVEACDEAGQTPDCDADCTLVECGDGTLNEAAGELCEGGGVSNGSCDASCQPVCDPGFASCNGEVGCETGIFDDPETCGGCDQSCEAGIPCRVGTCGAKRVFVTNRVYAMSDLGGSFDTIHSICQMEAVAGGIMDGTFRAWVAGPAAPGGPEGFVPSSAPYVRMDGALVANDFADLTDGTLMAPISLNAAGGTPSVDGGLCHGGTATCPFVFTSLGPDAQNLGPNCGLWIDPGGSFSPGDMTKAGAQWTSVGLTLSCGTPARLYCFEQ